MPHCGRCGTNNDESSKYCWKCGAILHQPETGLPHPPMDTARASLVASASRPQSGNHNSVEESTIAPIGSRFLAFLIDVAVLWVTVLLLGLAISSFSADSARNAYVVPAFYFPLVWGIAGTSVGKSVFHLRLTLQDGRAPGILRSIIRFVAMAFLSPLWISWWIVPFRQDKRAIHDLLSGTYLVLDKRSIENTGLVSAAVLVFVTFAIGAVTLLGTTPIGSRQTEVLPASPSREPAALEVHPPTPAGPREQPPVAPTEVEIRANLNSTIPTVMPISTAKPIVVITPIRGTTMWVCADVANVYAEPNASSTVVATVSLRDHWFVSASGTAGGWYLVTSLARAGSTDLGDVYAFMDKSTLCRESEEERKYLSLCSGYMGYPVRGVYRKNGSSLRYGAIGEAMSFAIDGNNNVYAGGMIMSICSNADCSTRTNAHNLIRWDGTNWSEVSHGVNGMVYSVLLDGNNNLYVGGIFTNVCSDALVPCTVGLKVNNIAKWNGAWSTLSSGVNGPVLSLEYDSSNNLYAGGGFINACPDATCGPGGTQLFSIAKWNGTWSALGNGIMGPVWALAADDGDNLFAGGDFTNLCAAPGCAPGTTVNSIAKWSAGAWSTLGSGIVPRTSWTVSGLDVRNGTLTATGTFSRAGDKVSANFAQYSYTYTRRLRLPLIIR